MNSIESQSIGRMRLIWLIDVAGHWWSLSVLALLCVCALAVQSKLLESYLWVHLFVCLFVVIESDSLLSIELYVSVSGANRIEKKLLV